MRLPAAEGAHDVVLQLGPCTVPVILHASVRLRILLAGFIRGRPCACRSRRVQ